MMHRSHIYYSVTGAVTGLRGEALAANMQGNDAATMAWPVAGGAKPPVTHAYWRKSAQVIK